MSHTCAYCGHIVFRTLHEYETHRAIYHGIRQTIRPEKVTGRSPARIVSDAEATWLGPFIVATDRPLVVIATNQEHLAACRCGECFDRKLDALISSQEEALKTQEEDHAE